MLNRVGTKGQVVIEKEIRDKLGIKPGSRAVQRIVNGHLEISFIPEAHNRSLFGSLRPHVPPEVLAEAEKLDWHEIKERAWEAAAHDRIRRMEDPGYEGEI
jgi:AbrB family looped-hinge helix DNA binding protein